MFHAKVRYAARLDLLYSRLQKFSSDRCLNYQVANLHSRNASCPAEAKRGRVGLVSGMGEVALAEERNRFERPFRGLAQ
jgi:hypothetical protein